jgi:hypothetical protein
MGYVWINRTTAAMTWAIIVMVQIVWRALVILIAVLEEPMITTTSIANQDSLASLD